MPQYTFKYWDEPEEAKKATLNPQDLGAAATRGAVSSGAIPMAIRFASGVASGFPSAVPGVGTLLGGALGGGGEVLAQMIEKGTIDPRELNLARVGVETGLGMIPFGRVAKTGETAAKIIGKMAVRGSGLAAAGTVGRKATSEDPNERAQALNPTKWSGWDLGGVAAGGALAGGITRYGLNKATGKELSRFKDLLGKGEAATADEAAELGQLQGKGWRLDEKGSPTQAPAPKVAVTNRADAIAEDFEKVKAGKLAWTPEQIQTKMSQLVVLKRPDLAHNIGIWAAEADKGNDAIYRAIETAKPFQQEVRNLNAIDKHVVDEVKDFTKGEQAAQKAANDSAAADILVQDEQQKLAEKLKGEATAATKAADLAGLKTQRSVSRTSKVVDPETGETITVAEVSKPAKKHPYDRGRTPPTEPDAPIAPEPSLPPPSPSGIVPPKAGVFQLVDSSGVVKAELSSGEEVLEFLEGIGDRAKTFRVVEPIGYVPTPVKNLPAKGAPDVDPVTGRIRPPSGVAAAKAGKKAKKEGSVLDQADKLRAQAEGKLSGTPGQVLEQLEKQPFNPPKITEVPTTPATKNPPGIKIINPDEIALTIKAPEPPVNPPEAPPAPAPVPAPPKTPPPAPPTAAAAIPVADVTDVEVKIEDLLKQYPAEIYAELGPLSKAYNVAVANAQKLKAEGAPKAAIDLANTARAEIATKMARITGQAELDGKIPEGFAAGITERIKALRKGTRTPVTGLRAGGKGQTPPPVKEALTEAPVAPTKASASVPFMITKQMESQLRELGYTEDVINKMTPAEAHAHLAAPQGPSTPSAAAPIAEMKPISPQESIKPIEETLGRMAAQKDKIRTSDALDDATKQQLLNEIDTAAAELEAKRLELFKQRAAKKGSGGTPLMSIGSFEGMRELIEKYPDLAAKLFSTAGGAAIGSQYTPDDPLKGALLGGAAGYGAPAALGALAKGRQTGTLTEQAQKLGRFLPNVYRGNLLFNYPGLPINVFAAPQGAGTVGSIERMLTGKLSGNTEMAAEGGQALKNLWNPVAQYKRAKESIGEASKALHGVNERGEMLLAEAKNPIEKATSLPGTAMYAGDLTARKAMTEAGVPEEIARAITLTANPKTKGGEGLVDLVKKHPSLALLQPFSRTAVNIVESGLERMPGVGILWNVLRNPVHKQAVAAVAAQQGLGAASFTAGYLVGQNLDPGDIKKRSAIMMLISNSGGQYGAVLNAGMAMGLAKQVGRDQGKALATSVTRELPLPESGMVGDTISSLWNMAQGQPAHPNAIHAPERLLPKALVPGFAKDRSIEFWKEKIKDLGANTPTYNFNYNW